jgi:8-oxo-dGTP pyrophosphatase MutT (NUDIX family)
MFEQSLITHHIQKYILQVLSRQESAKFSQMRPPKVDSNLYSYHLNKMISSGFVVKQDDGYSLSIKGMQYVEYTSNSSMRVRVQPKIVTTVLLKNQNDKYLLTQRLKQPYIGLWGLPMGKIHSNCDKTILNAAQRELYEKTNVTHEDLTHVGDMYLKIHLKDVLISDLLVHVFRASVQDEPVPNTTSSWSSQSEINKLKIIPGVNEIIESANEDAYFFKEISV